MQLRLDHDGHTWDYCCGISAGLQENSASTSDCGRASACGCNKMSTIMDNEQLIQTRITASGASYTSKL
jgi:hypothetical protein